MTAILTTSTLAAEYGVRITRRGNVWMASETVKGGLILARGTTLAALKIKLDRLFN